MHNLGRQADGNFGGGRFSWPSLCAVLLAATTSGFGGNALASGVAGLTLSNFVQQVVERNEKVQTQILELEFNRRRLGAERGAFEPVFFTEYSHQANKRENSVEQRNSQSGLNLFNERNNIYEGGIESLVPSGARVRLGYTLRDLNNNLPISALNSTRHTNAEYQTFFGLSVTQPLMKNAGQAANLAAIRVAALSSDLAYQDYRRQMMVIVSTAIAAYWELYLAQEQLRFFHDSVATAEKILNDNRARLQAGRGSELDVLEAQSGLALRRSKLADAEQSLYEAANKLLSLSSTTVLETNRAIRAVDIPQVDELNYGYLAAWKSARDINPDYLSQRLKSAQELVRLGYAKNQVLPELNLKASYGLNGLGETPGLSLNDLGRVDFPSWSLGAELRMPLAGNLKAQNELAAARLRVREAQVSMREIETQIANAIDTALHKISGARAAVQSYQAVVDYNTNLLDSALARLAVGKIESRKILDIEADLLEAKNSAAQAQVKFQRALLELELIQGTILQKHHLDLTQGELQELTAQLARRGNISDAEYENFISQVQFAYASRKTPLANADTATQMRARRLLESELYKSSPTNAPPILPDREPVDPLRQELRRKIQELRTPESNQFKP